MVYINIPNSTLSRDVHSRALVETDKKKAEEYKARTRILTETKSIKEEMEYLRSKVSEIDTIKNDISEIKELIRGLAR